jgi:hypothetical protein
MPRGLVRSGDFAHGAPVILPKNFGQGMKLPHNFGNIRGTQIVNRQTDIADGKYNQNSGIAQTASGEWLLTYNSGTGHSSASWHMLAHSKDQGLTWSTPVQQWFSTTPDPTLLTTPKGDVMITFGKLNSQSIAGAAYSRSLDSGYTWLPFTWLDNPLVANGTNFISQFLISGWNIFATTYTATAGTAELWFSSDDGYTFTRRSIIRQGGDAAINETGLAQVGATRLLAISRDVANTNTWAHFSNDMGVTWGAQIDYTPQVGVLQDPQMIQAGKALLLFGRNFAANQLLVFASYDGGVTFGQRTVLDTYLGSNIDGAYCQPMLRSDGSVYVTYYADSNGLHLPDIRSLVLYWGGS